MDTITEIEKLDAAQQRTRTIIPSSMVNLMSNKEDQCFQCQEPGHNTWNCPHIRCYECEEYGHIVMDCPHRIPPSGTLVPHHKAHRSCHTRLSSSALVLVPHHKAHRSCHTRLSSRHHQEDWERRDKSKSQSGYSRHHSSSCHDSHRGCSRSQQWDGHSCYRSRVQMIPISTLRT